MMFARLTIAQNTMQVVFGKEGQPVNAILLVLAEFRLNRYRNSIWFNFRSVKQLHQELTFSFPTLEQVVWEAGRIWKAGLISSSAKVHTEGTISNLEGHHFYKGCKCVGSD
jgi:hypothetical protein